MLVRTPRLALVLTLLLVALAAPVTLAGGGEVVPSDVSQGTVVLITGSGFDGGKPPKVSGQREGSKKAVRFQVLSHTDTVIQARVQKIPSSRKDPASDKVWSVTVSPRGPQAGPDVPVGGVVTRAPEARSVDPETASPGDEVTVLVADAGSGKLRAEVNGKKAKVLSVTPLLVEGIEDLSEVVVRVPQTHDGFFDVFVGNAVGTRSSDALLQVTGSTKPLGKDGLDALIDGAKYRARGASFSGVSNNGTLSVDARRGKKPERQLVVSAPFNLAVDEVPRQYVGLPEDDASISYGEIFPGQPVDGWAGAEGGIEVLVSAVEGDRVVLSFEGRLTSLGAEGEVGSERMLRGRATFTLPSPDVLVGDVVLGGDQEVPPVDTAASGTGTVTLDPSTGELTWNISYTGLTPTAAHFHGPAAAGQNAGVALGLNAGSNPIAGSSFLGQDDVDDLLSGLWYVNIHTAANPSGELRGQVIMR